MLRPWALPPLSMLPAAHDMRSSRDRWHAVQQLWRLQQQGLGSADQQRWSILAQAPRGPG